MTDCYFYLVVSIVMILRVGIIDARPGPPGRSPVMGWNTWCTTVECGVDWCNSEEVLSVANAIKSNGMLDAGYDHILLDDCWGTRDNVTNEIKGDPSRFPEGMAPFIAEIHKLGFKFGLYTDIGEKACHSPYVGSYNHYQQDSNTFAEWGVDYVKFDGCHVPGARSTLGDDNKTLEIEARLTANMSHALDNTGKHLWLNFHCWNVPPGDARCAAYGDSFRIYDDHHDSWNSTRRTIQYMSTYRQAWWGADPGKGWPDPDFVFTGGQGCSATAPTDPSAPAPLCPQQSETEYTTEFSMWALAGGQIVPAIEPRNLTAFQKKVLLNSEVLAVFKDTSGFGSIAMIADGTPLSRAAGAPSPRTGGPFPASSSPSCFVEYLGSSKPGTDSGCKEGVTYGCNSAASADGFATVWVDDDCRGLFKCNAVPSVVCESWSHKNVSCPCVLSQVWARPLQNGSAAAVALYNPSEAPQDITVHFAAVPDVSWATDSAATLRSKGFEGSAHRNRIDTSTNSSSSSSSSKTLSVRDLWKHSDLGKFRNTFTAKAVEPHGVVLIKITSA